MSQPLSGGSEFVIATPADVDRLPPALRAALGDMLRLNIGYRVRLSADGSRAEWSSPDGLNSGTIQLTGGVGPSNSDFRVQVLTPELISRLSVEMRSRLDAVMAGHPEPGLNGVQVVINNGEFQRPSHIVVPPTAGHGGLLAAILRSGDLSITHPDGRVEHRSMPIDATGQTHVRLLIEDGAITPAPSPLQGPAGSSAPAVVASSEATASQDVPGPLPYGRLAVVVLAMAVALGVTDLSGHGLGGHGFLLIAAGLVVIGTVLIALKGRQAGG